MLGRTGPSIIVPMLRRHCPSYQASCVWWRRPQPDRRESGFLSYGATGSHGSHVGVGEMTCEVREEPDFLGWTVQKAITLKRTESG
jgi:hypothetical protein